MLWSAARAVRSRCITHTLHLERSECNHLPAVHNSVRHQSTRSPVLTAYATLLKQPSAESKSIKIAGIVRSIRKQKKIAFAAISDGSTYQPIQVVLSPEAAVNVQNGAYVEIIGQWKESQGTGQSHELAATEVSFIGQSDPIISPIQKKSMSVDHLRQHPHLRLRIPLYSLLARVRSTVVGSVHSFYAGTSQAEDQATYVQPPLITSSDCEGAGETFTINPKAKTGVSALSKEKEEPYFRTSKYLTVSSQLHLEAYSAELGDVWTLSPTFRAEESDTARHLSEFWMLEAEFRNTTDLSGVLNKVEKLIKYISLSLISSPASRELLKYYSDAKDRVDDDAEVDLQARWDAVMQDQWPTITYAEAIKSLDAAAMSDKDLFRYTPSWDTGLQLEHERWLVENIGHNAPLFVTHYPKKVKPFYMLPSSESVQADQDRDTVACFDLLLPYGTCEVVGGSLREHRLEQLIMNMREKGLLKSSALSPDSKATSSQEDYPHLQPGESLNTLQWYADLRRFGSSPHGGFGLGFDRLLMYLTGVSNVRDIVAFPRTFGVAHC